MAVKYQDNFHLWDKHRPANGTPSATTIATSDSCSVSALSNLSLPGRTAPTSAPTIWQRTQPPMRSRSHGGSPRLCGSCTPGRRASCTAASTSYVGSIVGALADLPAFAGQRDPDSVIVAAAPERYADSIAHVTTASNVYASGTLLFEMFARHRPFPSHRRLHAATLFYQGQRPSRNEIPIGTEGDAVWGIFTRCRAQDPAERPDMVQVVTDLCLVSWR